MKKIAVVGENLVDLFREGNGFKAHAGGSPLNIAVGLSRLGEGVSYLTRFSYDFFGEFLMNTLRSEGVDISLCRVDDDLHTTLAFAFVDEDKVPAFEIWNRSTADGALAETDLEEVPLPDFDVIHFGSILLATPAGSAVLDFAGKAKKAGKLVSFDPNYRPRVAADEEKYRENLLNGWDISDIVKCSFEDAKELFGIESTEKAIEAVRARGITTILTAGKDGAYVVFEDEIVHIPAHATKIVDTTGCGDAFAAGMIHELSTAAFSLGRDGIVRAAKVGNATAAMAAQSQGAIASLPGLKDLENFLGKV